MKKFLFLFILLQGCQKETKISEVEISNMEEFARQVVQILNSNSPRAFRSAWDFELFQARFKGIGTSRESVLEYLDMEKRIQSSNFLLLDEITKRKGKAILTSTEMIDDWLMATVLIILPPDIYGFKQYRIEIGSSGNPGISDFFILENDVWYSQNVLDIIELNFDYNMFSEERRNANRNLDQASKAMEEGNPQLALEYLYEVPSTHWQGNYLTLKRIAAASQLSDSVYAEVLAREAQYNHSLFYTYFYHHALGDSVKVNTILDSLGQLTGSRHFIDSLNQEGYRWY